MSLSEVFRRFNRSWSQRVGLLEASHLGTGRPLNQSRLLFEIAQFDTGASVLELRERLGLDSGYLSRMLAQLTAEGVVEVAEDPEDRRRRAVRLTDQGRAAVREIDECSEKLVERVVDPLTPGQRRRLEEALATADLLIRAATLEIREISPDGAIAREALVRYFDELNQRFPSGFDAGDEPIDMAAVCLAAVSDGHLVAFGAYRPLVGGDAEIKRLWVNSDWRGAGIASRLMRLLEERAAADGFKRVVLDTNENLAEAIALYDRLGYERIERYNDNPYATSFHAKSLG
ncbi:bifunctional helix-turn-helix transcriptional regulator/GNAT family N-acetyltransferase [Tessaracoccus caeni]|uniref:bifunctional helix-turn-helix transcriptional regulator/GNAT family N-acetyltransferase n=1 Tax=Tessaracoccus caeni TaxID=3031239 RepID=UPI0023DB0C11|nr:helix-turn-helix domain-containing GNAT family N-acetyltransferase [Tessaracoccus caeni]MDF1488952.1 helix-turn-helix domain-containing GNAT family N-acetyltransferase [Tessaracoccus caeni]